jgi:hypothetical protein
MANNETPSAFGVAGIRKTAMPAIGAAAATDIVELIVLQLLEIVRNIDAP